MDDSSMKEDVLAELQKDQKRLPSKYFYDERGSELFEKITWLDEYYLTRTERKILKNNIEDISSNIGTEAMIVELGSGSSRKTRILLENLKKPAAYIPVDISEQYLLKAANNLRMEYPEITIIPVFEDYTKPFGLPDLGDTYNRQTVFFPGSTIGNFSPDEARSFMESISESTDPNSTFLIGVDLKKDREIMEAAYNDSEGITAKFNKNILRHLNRELDADFDFNQYAHNAFYNGDEGRIEMHLVSKKEQTVTINNKEIKIDEGESIHTENSYKYSLEEFKDLISNVYTVQEVWTDEDDYFSVQYLEKR